MLCTNGDVLFHVETQHYLHKYHAYVQVVKESR